MNTTAPTMKADITAPVIPAIDSWMTTKDAKVMIYKVWTEGLYIWVTDQA